jgi:hypothetical protein
MNECVESGPPSVQSLQFCRSVGQCGHDVSFVDLNLQTSRFSSLVYDRLGQLVVLITSESGSTNTPVAPMCSIGEMSTRQTPSRAELSEEA